MGYTYKRKDRKKLEERAKGDSNYPKTFKSEFSLYKPKEGKQKVRILPPTWEDPDLYVYDIWVHSSIGPDNLSFLCLTKMNKGKCPICKEIEKARRAGSQEEWLSEVRPYSRALVWVIDRKAESEGPKLWGMPKGCDTAFADLASSENPALFIDDPKDGYDLDFSKAGTGLNTKYSAHRIARDPSAMMPRKKDSATLLDYIVEHPLPSTLQFYDEEFIAKAFAGTVGSDDDDDDDDDEDSSMSQEEFDKNVDEAFGKKGKKGKKDKKRKKYDDSDDDDEDDSDDEDEPKKSKKKKKRKKLDEDGDDDAEPKKKKKKKKK
jgi:hypothetical protein